MSSTVKLIAFANPETPKEVRLICAPDVDLDGKNGVRHFIVLNGAWHGSWKDDTLTVGGVGTQMPMLLVWEGEGNSRGYNELIEMVQREIA